MKLVKLPDWLIFGENCERAKFFEFGEHGDFPRLAGFCKIGVIAILDSLDDTERKGMERKIQEKRKERKGRNGEGYQFLLTSSNFDQNVSLAM